MSYETCEIHGEAEHRETCVLCIAVINERWAEWKRRAEEAEELIPTAKRYGAMLMEREALAVQNDVLRAGLQYAIPLLPMIAIQQHPIVPGYKCCPACAALTLDLPRAAKITEARRNVCDADYALELALEKHDGTAKGSYEVQQAHIARKVALAELQKAEGQE